MSSCADFCLSSAIFWSFHFSHEVETRFFSISKSTIHPTIEDTSALGYSAMEKTTGEWWCDQCTHTHRSCRLTSYCNLWGSPPNASMFLLIHCTQQPGQEAPSSRKPLQPIHCSAQDVPGIQIHHPVINADKYDTFFWHLFPSYTAQAADPDENPLHKSRQHGQFILAVFAGVHILR